MQFAPTADGSVPIPGPIRIMERWRVAWHGRRDGKRPPSDPSRPQPYLESLRAQAELGQRAVNEWLHGRVDPVDREAVQVLILLDQHRRDPVLEPETAPARQADEGTDPNPASSIPPQVLKAREAAAAQKAYRRRVGEREKAEQRLGQLGSTRHHLIEVARAAADAHTARYEELVGLYRTALLRHDPDRHQAPRPPALSRAPWVHGDMPLRAGGKRALLTETTASDGTQEYRLGLSQQRANAVRDLLIGLGAPPDLIQTRGLGSDFPGYVPDRDQQGNLDPLPAAQNRQVIIELTRPD